MYAAFATLVRLVVLVAGQALYRINDHPGADGQQKNIRGYLDVAVAWWRHANLNYQRLRNAVINNIGWQRLSHRPLPGFSRRQATVVLLGQSRGTFACPLLLLVVISHGHPLRFREVSVDADGVVTGLLRFFVFLMLVLATVLTLLPFAATRMVGLVGAGLTRKKQAGEDGRDQATSDQNSSLHFLSPSVEVQQHRMLRIGRTGLGARPGS